MVSDEHRSFRALYTEHYSAVLGYCLRRVHRDDAPDLVSDTFAVAWRRRTTTPEAEFVLPWLYAIAAKTIANHRRAVGRRSRLIEKARRLTDRRDESPDVQVIRHAEDAAVIDAVARLRPNDREVLLLSAWEGLTSREIASRFGISNDAAEKRLTRAKQRLEAELKRVSKKIDVTPRVARRARKGGTG